MTDYWKAGNRKQVEGLLEIERRYSYVIEKEIETQLEVRREILT